MARESRPINTLMFLDNNFLAQILDGGEFDNAFLYFLYFSTPVSPLRRARLFFASTGFIFDWGLSPSLGLDRRLRWSPVGWNYGEHRIQGTVRGRGPDKVLRSNLLLGFRGRGWGYLF